MAEMSLTDPHCNSKFVTSWSVELVEYLSTLVNLNYQQIFFWHLQHIQQCTFEIALKVIVYVSVNNLAEVPDCSVCCSLTVTVIFCPFVMALITSRLQH